MSANTEKSDLSIFDTCKHISLREGYCEFCGLDVGIRLEMESCYSDNYMLMSKTEIKNFDNELNKLDTISDKLKNKVTDNLSREKRPIKEVSRKLDVFKQVYVAGAELNELNPNQMSKSLKLTGKNLNRSLRDISGTGRHAVTDEDGQTTTCPIVSISPIDSLQEMCSAIDKVQPFYENIKKLIELCIKKSPSLLNERPNYVSIGFIKFYCQVKGITIKDIGSYVNLPNPTINQYSSKVKKICELHNIVF